MLQHATLLCVCGQSFRVQLQWSEILFDKGVEMVLMLEHLQLQVLKERSKGRIMTEHS